MANCFDETVAHELWTSGELDQCIVYSIPYIQTRLASARKKLPARTQWDDLESEYGLYLVMAIHRYDPTKGAKIFSWINTYLRYAELDFIRKESKYYSRNVQL